MSSAPDHHPDPGGEAAARAAQLAAMVVSVAEAAARLRAHRLAAADAVAQQDAAADRAHHAAAAAAAKTVYGAALNDQWLRQGSTSELLDGWAAAGPHRAGDPLARLATDRIEERLRQLHPEAMAAYDSARAAGFPREDCLHVAALLWRGEYGLDPIGSPVAHSLADDARRRATVGCSSPDLGGTPTLDEHAAGLVDAARHDGHAAHLAARGVADPRVVVGQAFPVDIRTAMVTAPQAAKARLALVAAPQRRQLTATPHVPRSLR